MPTAARVAAVVVFARWARVRLIIGVAYLFHGVLARAPYNARLCVHEQAVSPWQI